MSTDDVKLEGPDLTQGVPLAALVEGAMLLGHAGGEPVLLARHGADVLAIGAVCSHYSGPLAQGLQVGDTVRCPLHHACFSLRTGEALLAPALNPVPSWEVEEQDGRVRVTRKLERAPLARSSVPTAHAAREPESVVIVGAGAAGSAAAEMLRREGYEGPIAMIDPDPAAPYDRPNISKDYLAGSAPEAWIPLRPEGFYAEHGVEVIRTAVTAVDAAAKRVVLADGSSRAFDRLLLATGADPVRLALPGADLPHVHYLRTLADSRAIIANAASGRRALVLGASFIGLEVAASLRARGLSVDVAAPEARPFERVLGAELGDAIRREHEAHGVRFHLGRTAAVIDRDRVALDDGSSVAADLVVIGVGVRPSVPLAERAGLAMDRGVLVNERLETSVAGIFAAGDIARWPDPHGGAPIRVEHWVVAQRQGQAAARNILGAREPFVMVPFFWSTHYDLTIRYVGHAERWDRIDVTGRIAAHDATLVYRLGDRVLAVATVGRDRANLAAEVALERDDPAAMAALPAS